jgi:transcription initiation factor TFIID TATA-box-binding protein
MDESLNGDSVKLEVKDDELEEETPEEVIDIDITNVVSNFATRCHLNLRTVATKGINVIYKREQAMVSMKLRTPKCTASIWSSGKITLTGSTSEENAKKAARRIGRILQKMGFKVRFSSFRVVNVLGIVNLPFGIKIAQFTECYPRICSYEPELHPGATYKYKEIKATYKIFQTGAITITAPSVANIDLAVQHIYPLLLPFRKEKPNDPHLAHMKRERERVEKENLALGLEIVTGKRKNSGPGGQLKKGKPGRRKSIDDSDPDNFINDTSDLEMGASDAVGSESEEEATFTDDD